MQPRSPLARCQCRAMLASDLCYLALIGNGAFRFPRDYKRYGTSPGLESQFVEFCSVRTTEDEDCFLIDSVSNRNIAQNHCLVCIRGGKYRLILYISGASPQCHTRCRHRCEAAPGSV